MVFSNRFDYISVRPEQLLLDPNNPRYQGDFPDFVIIPYSQLGLESHQEKAYDRLMNKRFAVKDLAESISQIGYLTIDNIVVIEYDINRYIVIEGNRRLAAIFMILRNHVNCSQDVLKTIEKIPAVLLKEPYEEASIDQWILQGTRHIGGVKQWGPYQKAKAIITLQDEKGYSLSETADILGLTKRDINKAVRALRALEACQKHPIFGRRVKPDHFSFFDEMNNKPFLRNYFQWDMYKMEFLSEERRDFFFTLFLGDPAKNIHPKITSAIQLRQLQRILKNENAIVSFEDLHESLDNALYISSMSDDSKDFKTILSNLAYYLNALENLGDTSLDSEQINKLIQIITNINQILSSKVRSD